MHSLDIRSVNLIYLVDSYPLCLFFLIYFNYCLSTLYISSIKLWSSTLCPFNVELWFPKNLQWSKTWNLLATTRNSLHHYWVQPYWLESTEDPKISPVDLSHAKLFGRHNFGMRLKLRNRNVCSPGFSICDCYCQNSCQQFKEKPLRREEMIFLDALPSLSFKLSL